MDQIDQCFNILITNEKYPYKFKCPNQSNYIEEIGTDFKDLSEFRKIFGHIGPFDLSQHRLGEYEDAILKKLLTQNKQGDKNDIDWGKDWLRNFEKEYTNLKLDLNEDFKNLKSWLSYAKIFMEFREIMKFELLKIIYLLKIITKEISVRFNLGDLIYYLNCDELDHLVESLNQFRLIGMKRKAYFNACRYLEVENVIMENNESNIKLKSPSLKNTNGLYKTVIGETIHHGEAEGFCLVAKNPHEFYTKLIKYRDDRIRNIIGIFKSVEPAYFNLEELDGIITEFGGQLAHAATICREKNIPYITNIKIDLFQDGQYIIFDTSKHQVIYRE